MFDNIFAFHGATDSAGLISSLSGEFFDKNTASAGKNFPDFVFGQKDSYLRETLQKALHQAGKGDIVKIETEYNISEGKNKVLDLTLLPQCDDTGKISEINFCAYDITTHRQERDFYKKQSEHYLFAAENADIGLWYWDLVSDSISSSPKCNEFYGLAPHDIITLETFFDCVYPDDREKVAAELKKAHEDLTEYDTEYRVVSGDGKVDWIAARGKVFIDEKTQEPLNMMGIVRKITDRKAAESELQRLYESERQARDEAVEANRTKDYFLAIVSHELRTPLNAILGWTKILLKKDVDETTRRNALETIERSAKAQAKLIEDLVDTARIASGKLRLELRPINYFELLKNVCLQNKPAAVAKNINLEFIYDTENMQIFGDAVRIQQIFSNLLSNALKFTPVGGNIKVSLTADENQVTAKVSDNGRGIAPDYLPNIFRQFSQAEEKSGGKSGLGLGLAIVKTLVEKHDGKIVAHSEGEGKGATFTVTFPLYGAAKSSDAKAVKQQAQSIEQEILTNVKILLVEDDEDSRDVLTLYLEQCGAIITSADSAYKAADFLQQSNGNFDIIISDLGMPGEDGYTFMSKVRNLSADKGGKIPSIALSAFTTTENKERALSVGFQTYHTKPFEPDLLINQIAELVGRK